MADSNGISHVGVVLPAAGGGWRIKAAAQGSSWAVLLEAQTWAAAWNTIRFSVAANGDGDGLGVLYAAAARQMAWLRALMFCRLWCRPCASRLAYSCSIRNGRLRWLLTATYALLAYPFVAKDVLAAWDGLPKRLRGGGAHHGRKRFSDGLLCNCAFIETGCGAA